MDLFGMYGSRSDDEPVAAPTPPPGPEPAALLEEADTAPVARVPSASDDAVARFIESMDDVEFDAQIVRPYARTGGRTRSVAGLELETLLSLTVAELPRDLPPEHYAISELCRRSVSVAEVSGYRSLPIGAARVIISDLIELGLVVPAGPTTDGAPTVDLMRRVLEGLHRL